MLDVGDVLGKTCFVAFGGRALGADAILLLLEQSSTGGYLRHAQARLSCTHDDVTVNTDLAQNENLAREI
ncbi:hypothetical protein [Rathayibacter agropyri]|uniref:hypothetical protein n=1 Tax=Rathayibacter agropyri TaxID=1634927 RepID=UPI0015644FC9|nr:hypothetical protein [Rathayibacter agropyri]NRD08351.1 hypothetical protein [Rathayibacter agropyri]